VKIGITAPREVPILRQEIYVAIQEQNRLQELLVCGPEPDSFKDLRELLVTTNRAFPPNPIDQPAESTPAPIAPG
jgi:hypothetical protein